MVKQSDFISYVKSLVGRGVDQDGYYGYQCVDLIMHVNEKYFGMRTWGNAIHYASNAMPAGYKRYTKGQVTPQPGDVLVWKWGSWDVYGHIGICTAYDGRNITSVEQNVDGGPNSLTSGGPARYRTRTDACLVAILRPPLELDDQTQGQYWTRVPELGVFTVTVQCLNVRNEPSVNNIPVASYAEGGVINYDSYTVANGYVWISYVSHSGTRRYVAVGQHDGQRRINAYGTFAAPQ